MPTIEDLQEYIKRLEAENESMRRKWDTDSPTIGEIMGKFFTLTKTINRKGEETFCVVSNPNAYSLKMGDYNYLRDIGIPEDPEVDERIETARAEAVDTGYPEVNKILDEYYNKIEDTKALTMNEYNDIARAEYGDSQSSK
jgi:hypothetical protein